MKIDKNTKDNLINYFELGLSLDDVMTLTSLSIQDIHSICNKYPDVKQAKSVGVKKTNIKVLEALIKSAVGYEYTEEDIMEVKGRNNTVVTTTTTKKKKYVQPNVKAIQMWLQNRDNEWDKEIVSESEKNLNIKVKVSGKDIIVTNNNNEEEDK